MNADALYTEIIMMHNKSGHNKRIPKQSTQAERGHNPNCGDDLTLMLQVSEGMVIDAGYQGSGCAISQASMSIMIDTVKGLPVEEAKAKAALFFKMIRGEVLNEDEQEQLGDAVIFDTLAKMPARVKCGTLGWHCLEVCLSKNEII